MTKSAYQWMSMLAGLAMLAGTNMAAAHTSEVFFARAGVENQHNRPAANVMVLLDTSGSMRNCEQGSGSTWCTDIANRRITMLHNAMKTLIDNVQPGVNLGLARFSSNGGTILTPVMEVNDITRPVFLDELNKINQGQNSTRPGSSAQPSGGTPTARAFEEVSRYMLGLERGSLSGNPGPAICVKRGVLETNCREQPVTFGEWQAVDWCNEADALTCQTSLGAWEQINPGSSGQAPCDITRSDRCRIEWGNWVREQICNPNVTPLTCEREPKGRRRYRSGQYWMRPVSYQARVPLTFERVCDYEEQCVEERKIHEDGAYVSPINTLNECESNHVIIFTDGAPSNENTGNLGFVDCRTWWGANLDSYACQQTIAGYLNSEDNLKGRVINTHNIGLYMGTNEGNMRNVSDAGGGTTSNADNAQELVDAFLDNMDLISRESRAITAPGVAVNQMSRLQHMGQLYYSVFQPEELGVWQGNLKKYGVDGEAVLDATGARAVDPDTGFFRTAARSYWSRVVDGQDATKGGARERLESRRLFYSDDNDNTYRLTDARLSTMTPADLGIPNGSSVTPAVVANRLAGLWADPLHSVPVLVNYDASSTDPDDQENYVFVSTNGGMLHAVDTISGEEKFAFMPHEMLSKAYSFTHPGGLNEDNSRPVYGLDGSWVAWRRANEAGTNRASAVYLYGGMRRGGNYYYALDVSDIDSPELIWKIGPETAGFDLLGQTWSTPTLIQLRINGERVPALVFGGGYSPQDHDKQFNDGQAPELKNRDQMGRAIYMVNALTGQLIWSASADATNAGAAGHTRVDTMNWAIPASIAVVDKDLDGYADHFYVGDLAGQVFRVDVNAGATSAGEAISRVVRLASFREGGVSGVRRFFETPAVAYVEHQGQRKLVVAVGSGYRAHPLDTTISERFYVIHDDTVFRSGDSGYEPPQVIGMGDLAYVTSLPVSDNELNTKKGWVLTLAREGEKVMAAPMIFNGRLMFTTYAPFREDQSDTPCKVQLGKSYFYVVDLMTSRPANVNNDGEVSNTREEELAADVPAPSPQVIILEDGSVAVVVGTEVFGDVDAGRMDLRKHRWYPLERNQANEYMNRTGQDANP